MRGKRSKQYRKLMLQYGLSFGFREPYQVLLDAEIIKDADKFKMDLIGGLERTLHGQVKPMITQCSMRHLYAQQKTDSSVSYIIDKAQSYERRRCGHIGDDYPEPLSTKDCLASAVDPKGSKTNKHCYVVASQDLEVRKAMRSVLGVPLVYINRSVMIMEPMAGATAENREREERRKFRDGLKRGSGSLKRKRENEEDEVRVSTKKRTVKGAKGPNSLAVKKSKKKGEGDPQSKDEKSGHAGSKDVAGSMKKEHKTEMGAENSNPRQADGYEPSAKRKRKRKHKSGENGGAGETQSEGADDQLL